MLNDGDIGLCAGCAFRAGTDANTYSPTKIKARLCLETGEPFYCHERDKIGAAPTSVCRGFLAARQKRVDLSKNAFSQGQHSVARSLIRALGGKA